MIRRTSCKCCWIEAKMLQAIIHKGDHICWRIGSESSNLVPSRLNNPVSVTRGQSASNRDWIIQSRYLEDIEYQLPVKFRWNWCNNCHEVVNASVNQTPERPFLHFQGEGRCVHMFCSISLYVQWISIGSFGKYWHIFKIISYTFCLLRFG